MKSNYKRLGDYIRPVDIRNKDLRVSRLLGVSIEKKFIESIANTIGTDMTTYKIVKKGQFAYGPVTSRNGDKISIALLEEGECIISSSYSVFEIIDSDILLPQYLNLWFKRPEFDRYARFHSHGSAREIFDWEEMCNMELPIPPLAEQQKIVDAYNTIERRIELKRKINENLEEQLRCDLLKLFTLNKATFDCIPNGWSLASIGTYCDIKSGYAFKSEWWQDNGIKVIKIANIRELTIDLCNCSCVSKENADKATQFSAQAGDVLIAMTGATVGKFGIVPCVKFPLRVNQRVGKFFLGDEPLSRAPFLLATLLQKEIIKQLQPDGETGSAQDNLSPDDIRDIQIILPTKEIIECFNQTHAIMLRQMMLNFSEMPLLKNVQSSLLQTMSNRSINKSR